jgi:membrane associated rhomboid family serine protease
MIPLRDSTRSLSSPLVVYLIIATCVVVFLYTQSLGGAATERFYLTYGAIPAAVTAGAWPAAALGLVTSMFLHGSWLHLGGNMLYLWVFGDNIEDAMGHGRFVVFYLLTGVVAALAHILVQPSSQVPLVGASGAIAGVLGGYLVLYPHARIQSLLILGWFWRVAELPALLVLSLWFLFELLQATMTLGAGQVASIAFWAHVGGFAAGALVVRVFTAGRATARDY